MRAELMKSEHVQKRYNRIKADQGNQAAENWLSMLIRSLLICQEHPWLQSWDELTIMFKILHDEEINRLKQLKANGYKLISSMGI